MRNLWIGMVIGAATGAGIGALADGSRRARQVVAETGQSVSHAVKQRTPQLAKAAATQIETSKEHTMGAVDKAKNKAEELAGKAKEAAGKATGDADTEAEGRTDQAKGDLKQAGEKVKDAFKD